ncbi:hypothetical protein F5Y08DRAFT_323690 [Xylaria arbuscula]|nr:hypothetical protein F5Y08DRAFT_323690 [Xylaria arbuscula]
MAPLPMRRGTGLVLPTLFEPPPLSRRSDLNDTPEKLFPGGSCLARPDRYVYYFNPRRILIFTYGSLFPINRPSQEKNPPKSTGINKIVKDGWAVIYGPGRDGRPPLTVSGCLEGKGPFGDSEPPTHERARLRAIIAALRIRNWVAEGFSTITIATPLSMDSLLNIRKWVERGWRTKTSTVKDRDL